MKIALCQINTIIGDIAGNKEKILRYYRRAQKDNVDLAIFPELSLPGYPPLDLIEKEEFRDTVKSAASELASSSSATGLLFGSITEDYDLVGTGIYSSAILCFEGKIQFVRNKMLIPNYDVFDEVRYFEPAKDVNVFPFRGENLGISICEDIWNDSDYWKNRRYESDPIEILREKGASLLINISASPYAFGRREERRKMLSVLTSNDNLPLAYVCCVGAQTELIFDGGSMCFNAKGDLLKLGKFFQEDYFIFDTSEPSKPVTVCERSFSEETLDALILGVRDYAEKSGFKKVIVGLSGGIDSALVTYIAAKAMGSDNVLVMLMPSKYSSSGSIDDSEKLVHNLNISRENIGIQPVVDQILDVLKPAFGNKGTDITEENIQARVRGLYLMAMSNKFGYLLCATGNKSELAVGYATLYGDMCGALAVIGDVYKTQVYEIANYINLNEEIIPQAIIDKAPSAELKPGQVDQDSLPPYEFLDKILRYYLEEYKESGYIIENLGKPEIVKKMLKLVDRNEFKRKQAAPVLRISKKAFGYGRRFPIVQNWQRCC